MIPQIAEGKETSVQSAIANSFRASETSARMRDQTASKLHSILMECFVNHNLGNEAILVQTAMVLILLWFRLDRQIEWPRELYLILRSSGDERLSEYLIL